MAEGQDREDLRMMTRHGEEVCAWFDFGSVKYVFVEVAQSLQYGFAFDAVVYNGVESLD